jgi:hypothetical protein
MSISQASIKDYKEIAEFIKKNYSANHILTKNKKVFFYFYAKKTKINFLILKYKKKIISILGFLINNHKKKYIWLALWVSKKNQIFSGIKLLKRLENNFKKRIFVLGLNDYTKKIMEQLNYKVKTMNHYYFINNNVDKFKIIKNPLSNKKKLNKNSQLFFEEVKRKNLNKYNKIILSRSFMDFQDFKFKYINNQFYYYKFYLLKKDNRKLLIITRTIEVKKINRKVIRVIDAFGNYNLFKYTRNFFLYLLKDLSIEYIDLINVGISSNFFFCSGMNLINYNKTIVPNFFEPFKKENKKIYFAYNKIFKKKIIVFKGDGDQERPNLL